MGKAAKGSRKGKKAWRANIRTDDIDDFFEKQTRDAHAGAAAIPSLPSDSLFYLDKPTSAFSSTSDASDPTPKGQQPLLSSATAVVRFQSGEGFGF